jgi:hypothetical protein
MDVEKERVRHAAKSGLQDALVLLCFSAHVAAPQRTNWRVGAPARAQELLWIAREGLKAPLPQEWKPW